MEPIRAVCTIQDLRKLEVINLCDGRRLGIVCDVEFDLCQGCICALLIPKKMQFCNLWKKDNLRYYRIPWCQIERIGDDTILVRWSEVVV
jgi:YlmC/YmxH family sporulation protein